MAIKGSLKEASLPDVIQLLFLGRRTGCLALADRHNFGTIYFDEGQIVYAAIVNRRDRLGDILMRSGRITAEQLREAVDRQQGDRDQKLGEILVQLGFLPREELERYIRVQIEEAVYYLFTWTSGTFNFEAGVRPEREDFLVRINPEYLLLEGARRVDEWSLIEKKIPSFDLIFAVDGTHIGDSAPELSEEQRRLVPAAGRHPRRGPADRGERAGRVRGGQGALRPHHRRVRPPGGHLGRDRPAGQRQPGGRAPQPRASRSTRRRCWTRRCASSAASPISGPPTPARRSSSA